MDKEYPEEPTQWREFLPGACRTGEAREVFEALDRTSINHATDAAIEIARHACQLCIQKDACTQQREAIAQSLHVRGAQLPVVGGEVMPTPYEGLSSDVLPNSEKIAAEPAFQFELAEVLEKVEHPQDMIALIRQMNFSKQKRLSGGKVSPSASGAVERLVEMEHVEELYSTFGFDREQTRRILTPFASALVHFSRAASESYDAWQRLPEDQKSSYATLEQIAPQVLDEAKQIQELGLDNPVLASCHRPEHLKMILETYRDSPCIGEKTLYYMLEKYSIDPVPQIARVVEQNDQSRRGEKTSHITSKEELITALKQEFEYWPPYMNDAMLRRMVRKAKSVEDAKARMERVCTSEATHVWEEYASHPDLTHSVLREFISAGATEARVQEYIDRTALLSARFSAYNAAIADTARQGVGRPNSFTDTHDKNETTPHIIRRLAMSSDSEDMSAEEIAVFVHADTIKNAIEYEYDVQGERCVLKPWIYRKVVRYTTSEEDCRLVCKNVNELLQAGMLQYSLLSCALEEGLGESGSVANTIADSSTGEYLSFNAEINQLSEDDRTLLARLYQLDYLIYGRNLTDVYPKETISDEQANALFAHLESIGFKNLPSLANYSGHLSDASPDTTEDSTIESVPLPEYEIREQSEQNEQEQEFVKGLRLLIHKMNGDGEEAKALIEHFFADKDTLPSPATFKLLKRIEKEYVVYQQQAHIDSEEQKIGHFVFSSILGDKKKGLAPRSFNAALDSLTTYYKRDLSSHVALESASGVLQEFLENIDDADRPAPKPSDTSSQHLPPEQPEEKQENEKELITAGSQYRKTANRFELLNAEEEVELAKEIEAGVYAQQIIDGESPLSESIRNKYENIGEAIEDLEEIARRGENAREKFIYSNLRLVMNVANKMMSERGDLAFDDLVQFGNAGLMHAVEKFDFTKGFKFSSYAMWWIKQSIRRGVRDTRETIRFPQRLHDQITKMNKAKRTFLAEHEREPTAAELASIIEKPEEWVEHMQRISKSVASLNMPLGSEGGSDELGDVLPTEGDFTEEIIDALDSDFMIGKMQGILTDQEFRIVVQQYMHGQIPREIGESEGITGERVRQISDVALEKLRTALAE